LAVETRSEIVPVTLQSGQTIQVEATVKSQEEDVAFAVPSIEGLSEAIEGLSASILDGLKRIQPRKATVEFGIEVGLEAGKLTALLVKGTGTASINVTLEWGE
jgi:hypothetical protein